MKEKEVNELSKMSHILAFSEFWLEDLVLLPELDISEVIQPDHESTNERGFAGVGNIVYPLIRYKVIAERATKQYQFITMGIGTVSIAQTYISPAASTCQMEEALKYIIQLCGPQGIIMGDLNARHITWDSATNGRGRTRYQWAVTHGFIIKSTAEPTLLSNRGNSKLDLFLSRKIGIVDVNEIHGPWTGFSDHMPIRAEAMFRYGLMKQKQKRNIPLRQRRKPIRCARALKEWANVMPGMPNKIGHCKEATQIEQCYALFEEGSLRPWQSFTTVPPKRYNQFWNRNRDAM